MTNPGEETHPNDKPSESHGTSDQNETAASEGQSSSAASPSANAEQTASAEQAVNADVTTQEHRSDGVDDELPEFEELTPEIVEEEAIRGDFMLRWASIFLAILFGFSEIADTRTLIHVRSGDAMQSSGWLPSAETSLSYTLEGQSVPNVSWLFDHVVSFAYSAGGPMGLTALKALVAGLIAYILSLISVSGMPTWWSSICCVFAICAASVDFLPVTDLVTLLGLSLTLYWLHSYQAGRTNGFVGRFAVLMLIWANMDPRAWLGIVAVFCFSVGLIVCRRRADSAGEPLGSPVDSLVKAAGLGVLMLLVNPSPVASLLSPVTTYSTEFPSHAALKPLSDADGRPLDTASLLDGRTEYYSLLNPAVFHGFEFAYVAGISLWIIALVVLLLGRHRDDLPWAVTLLVFVGLAIWKLHELPAAALVAAVAAGVAAQRWYGRTFRQDYSIDSMEVLFSRGGRALTVFAMALLGFCAVADRLPTRSPIGTGFEANLQATIDSLGIQLEDIPQDARILNTRMNQGDVLIWHGRLSFLDSRGELFGKPDDPTSIARQFEDIRRGLVRPSSPPDSQATLPGMEGITENNEQWKTDYANHQITHLMIRLAPPGNPAYGMVTNLQRLPDWTLISRGPSAAFFVKGGGAVLQKTAFDSRRPAFQESEDINVERFDFARQPDFYQKYIYASRHPSSAPLRDARHYFTLDSQLSPQILYNVVMALANDPKNDQYRELLGKALAGPVMTIRRANQALRDDPQNADAYRLLGGAYSQLMLFEKAISEARQGVDIETVRYNQAVMALHQSATIDPDRPETWNALINLYRIRNRTDCELTATDQYLRLTEEDLLNNPDAEEFLRSIYEQRRALMERKETMQARLDEVLSGNIPEDPRENAQQKIIIASQLYNDGFVELALGILEDNIDLVRAVPQAEVLRGQLLMETGRLEDAFAVLNQLAAVIRDNPGQPEFAAVRWHTPVALSQLAKAAYPAAIEAWEDQASVFDSYETQAVGEFRNLIRSLPLVAAVDSNLAAVLPTFATSLVVQSQLPLSIVPAARFEPKFMTAMANIEQGNPANARFILEGLVADGGENPLRPLAEAYLLQLSGKADEIIESTAVSLWEDFTFPEASESGGKDASPAESKASADNPAPGTESAPENTDKKSEVKEKTDAKPQDATSKDPSADPNTATSEENNSSKPDRTDASADKPAKSQNE